MYRQLGMRVFVLLVHTDTKGEVLIEVPEFTGVVMTLMTFLKGMPLAVFGQTGSQEK